MMPGVNQNINVVVTFTTTTLISPMWPVVKFLSSLGTVPPAAFYCLGKEGIFHNSRVGSLMQDKLSIMSSSFPLGFILEILQSAHQ